MDWPWRERSWKSLAWRVAAQVDAGARSPNRGPQVEATLKERVQRCRHKLWTERKPEVIKSPGQAPVEAAATPRP